MDELKRRFSGAIDDCNLQLMKQILDQGLDVNEINDNGITYLHMAVEKNSYEMVELMIHKGVDLNKRDIYGRTALLSSLWVSYSIFKLILDVGADMDIQDNDGNNPLLLASEIYSTVNVGNIKEKVALLLEKGANVAIRDLRGYTPLHRAALQHFDLVELLLKTNVSLINMKTEEGFTPLHLACECNLEIVLLLLENGADVNAVTSDGQTPLHRVFNSRDSNKIIQVLLDNGAKINIKSNDGMSPLHNACYIGRSANTVDFLIDNGAEVNAQDMNGRTPLFYAIEGNNSIKIAKTMLERGANLNVKINEFGDNLYNWIVGNENESTSLFALQEFKKLFSYHILKMKLADLRIDVDIRKQPITPGYEKMKIKFMVELEKVKTVKLKGLSLCKILFYENKPYNLSIEDVSKYDDVMNSEGFLTMFPEYGHILRNLFNKSKQLTRAVDSFNHEGRKEICRILPILAREKIVAYLNMEDIIHFLRSEKHE